MSNYKAFEKLINLLESLQKDISHRIRKCTLKGLLCQKILELSLQLGTKPSTSLFNRISMVNVTSQSVNRFEHKIPLNILNLIRTTVNSYQLPKGKRVFAVDGTRLALNRSIAESDPQYRLTPSKSYTDALLTTIYNVDQKIPYGWHLSGHHNERKGFLAILNDVARGDTVIFDRGYYSQELVTNLERKGIHYIFRLKMNSKLSRLEGDDVIIKGSQRRAFYRIKGTTYSLLSNLGSKIAINKLGDLYHSRWKIEEWYKTLKTQLKGKFYPQKTLLRVQQKLEWQQIVYSVHRLLCQDATKVSEMKKSQNISSLYVAQNAIEIAKCIYHQKWELLENMIVFLRYNCISIEVKGRHYPRKGIIDGGKWYRGKGLVNNG